MNVGELYEYVNDVLHQDFTGLVTVDTFNAFARESQLELINELFGVDGNMPTNNYGNSQTNLDFLRTVSRLTTINKSNGVFAYPDDYNYATSIGVQLIKDSDCEKKLFAPKNLPDEGCTYKVITVEESAFSVGGTELNVGELFTYELGQAILGRATALKQDIERYNASIVPDSEIGMTLTKKGYSPKITSPYAVLYDDGILIYPTKINTIILGYIAVPASPVFGFTVTNGVPVYNPLTSTELTLPIATHKQIADKIIQKASVALNYDLGIQYSSATDQMNK